MDKAYSVFEVHQIIAQTFDHILGVIAIEAEVSQGKFSPSGHFYFTVKDPKATLDCVIFKGRIQGKQIKVGDHLRIKGKLSTYAPSGRLQFIVENFETKGLGDLYNKFLELKKKLESEGLFDLQRKKPLPRFPKNIGLITSLTGSVIKDFCSVMNRRTKNINIFIFPALVQGKTAPENLIANLKTALEFSETKTKLDTVVIMRGGGSFEDLFCFNDEQLVRTISSFPIPTISAVGHETDFTICDFVADFRAATPSVAAEVLSSPSAELKSSLIKLSQNIISLSLMKVHRIKEKVHFLKKLCISPEQKLIFQRQKVDELILRIYRAYGRRVQFLQQRLTSISQLLLAINPSHVLKRGFSITYSNGKIVGTSKEFPKGKSALQIQFSDGLVKGYFDEN